MRRVAALATLKLAVLITELSRLKSVAVTRSERDRKEVWKMSVIGDVSEVVLVEMRVSIKVVLCVILRIAEEVALSCAAVAVMVTPLTCRDAPVTYDKGSNRTACSALIRVRSVPMRLELLKVMCVPVRLAPLTDMRESVIEIDPLALNLTLAQDGIVKTVFSMVRLSCVVRDNVVGLSVSVLRRRLAPENDIVVVVKEGFDGNTSLE